MAVGVGLTLAAHVAIVDQLVLDYEVWNASPRDVYLLNRIYRPTPSWRMGPDIVYVELVPSTRTVRLMKKIDDLPKGVNVTAPVAPFVTPLRSGAVFKETVRVPLPVRERREYQEYARRKRAREPDTAVYPNVTFTLGYYFRAEGTREEKRDVHGMEVILPMAPRGRLAEFGLLESGPFRVDVPVVPP